MTIRDREFGARLSALEYAAEIAPRGTFDDAKRIAEAIAAVSDFARERLREAGVQVANDDRLRNVEVALYRYVLESNPEASFLLVAEGFGESAHHSDTTVRMLADHARLKRSKQFLSPED